MQIFPEIYPFLKHLPAIPVLFNFASFSNYLAVILMLEIRAAAF
jgi:hypothetical protein